MVRTRIRQVEQIRSSYSYDDHLNMGSASEKQSGETIGTSGATIVNFPTVNTVVISGDGNTASGDRSFIGTGYLNTTAGQYAFVGCGISNAASGNYSFIGVLLQNRQPVNLSYAFQEYSDFPNICRRRPAPFSAQHSYPVIDKFCPASPGYRRS